MNCRRILTIPLIVLAAPLFLSVSACSGYRVPTDNDLKQMYEDHRACFDGTAAYLASHPGQVVITDSASGLTIDPPGFDLGDRDFWTRCVREMNVLEIWSSNDSLLGVDEDGIDSTYKAGSQYGPYVGYLVFATAAWAPFPYVQKSIVFVEQDSKVETVPNTDDYDVSKAKPKPLRRFRTIYSKIADHWFVALRKL